jgi:eukaryotic-like serine/threonine-protein kinase
MSLIGGRYMRTPDLKPLSNGNLFSAKDQSLHRDVLLYRIGDSQSPDAGIHMLGRALELNNERFLHILDIGTEGSELFAVLKYSPGQPMQPILKQHRMTTMDILTEIIRLGQAIQEGSDAGFGGFSVTAENLWLSQDGKLIIINGWSAAENGGSGALGLRRLLYQLCVGSESVPDDFETYENQLRLSMHGLREDQINAIVACTRRIIVERLSVSEFVLAILKHIKKAERQAIPFVPRENKILERTKTKPITGKRKTLVIIAAFIAVFFIGAWISKITHPISEQDRVRYPFIETQNLDETQQPIARETPTVKPTQASEIVSMPNLIGLSKEAAEKEAITARLHYTFYMENNDQEKGKVFKQEPQYGASISKGDDIIFWISKGR